MWSTCARISEIGCQQSYVWFMAVLRMGAIKEHARDTSCDILNVTLFIRCRLLERFEGLD
jgi:hypothetical protein